MNIKRDDGSPWYAYVLLCLLVLAGCVGISAGIGWLFAQLWNGVVVDAFHGPALSFGQAWGLLSIVAILRCVWGRGRREKE